jgi:F-type H+-transporting ATPase subunit gamma
MKAMSAANVRKGATALAYTRKYREFVSGAASEVVSLPGISISEPGERRLVVAFGSQYGLCGPLNEHVATEIARVRESLDGVDTVVTVGARLGMNMSGDGYEALDGPGSVEGIDESIGGLLETIYDSYNRGGFDELYFVYPVFKGDMVDVPVVRVIPPEFPKAGKDSDPPLMQLDPRNLMDGIFEEYVYISLFATALEAVIAENESRMRAMEQAEKIILKKIDEATLSYNYALQEEVTSELIEIIGGYEALGGDKGVG